MATLSVTAVPPPGVTAVTLSPAQVQGGNPTTQNTVTLSGPAPAGGAVVMLSSNNAAATVPNTVTVAAGATVSPAFTINTTAVSSTANVTISASYGGSSATAMLSVTAASGSGAAGV